MATFVNNIEIRENGKPIASVGREQVYDRKIPNLGVVPCVRRKLGRKATYYPVQGGIGEQLFIEVGATQEGNK